jgi:hypothetical protein
MSQLRADISGALAETNEPMTAKVLVDKLGKAYTRKEINSALYSGPFAKVANASPPAWVLETDSNCAAGSAIADPTSRAASKGFGLPGRPPFAAVPENLSETTLILAGRRVAERRLPELLTLIKGAKKIILTGEVGAQVSVWGAMLEGVDFETLDLPPMDDWTARLECIRALAKDAKDAKGAKDAKDANRPLFTSQPSNTFETYLVAACDLIAGPDRVYGFA